MILMIFYQKTDLFIKNITGIIIHPCPYSIPTWQLHIQNPLSSVSSIPPPMHLKLTPCVICFIYSNLVHLVHSQWKFFSFATISQSFMSVPPMNYLTTNLYFYPDINHAWYSSPPTPACLQSLHHSCTVQCFGWLQVFKLIDPHAPWTPKST